MTNQYGRSKKKKNWMQNEEIESQRGVEGGGGQNVPQYIAALQSHEGVA